MKRLNVILWLIVLILTGFLVQGRQKLIELRDKQEALMKRNGEQSDGHQESTGKFRTSMRASSDDKRAAAEKLISDWRDLVNLSENVPYDQESVARRLSAEIDMFDRLRHIDPNQWAYIIEHLKDLGPDNELEAYATMASVNSRKLLELMLDTPETVTEADTKHLIFQLALSYSASQDPIGMIDWIAAHSNDYSEWINEEAKLDFLNRVARIDTRLALQCISKLGIADAQSALNAIFQSWNDSETHMDKLEIVRSLRNNSDFNDLNFGNAYGQIVFKENGVLKDYPKIIDSIESTNFTQDEMAIIMRNTPCEAITGHEVEWIDWANNQNISEEVRNKSIRIQMSLWTLRSFEEASNWMKLSGDMNLRKACLPEFLGVLKRKAMDIDAYIESMPEGELRDYAKQYVSERK